MSLTLNHFECGWKSDVGEGRVDARGMVGGIAYRRVVGSSGQVFGQLHINILAITLSVREW